jgi:thioesterase domain-containing protein
MTAASTDADQLIEKAGFASTSMEQLAANVMWAEALRRAKTAIAPLSVRGDRIPIYWVHSVTGQGSDPIALATLLGPHQPFYSIRAPSAKRVEDFATSIEEMAGYYAEQIVRFQPRGPLIVGGWSAGVVVAFELAQQLEGLGRDVRHLIAVDFVPNNSGIKINGIKLFAMKVIYWLRKEGGSRTSYRQIGKQTWRKILDTISASIGTGHPMDDLIASRRYSPDEAAFVRRLHDEVDRYKPRCYGGSVLFYPAVEEDGRKAASNRNLDANNMIRAWQVLAADLTISKINGDHGSLLKGTSVPELAERLRSDLQRFDGAARRRSA